MKGMKKLVESDGSRFLPLALENVGIEFRTGKECEDNRADAGKKLDPKLVGSKHGGADDGTDDQLSDCSDNNLG